MKLGALVVCTLVAACGSSNQPAPAAPEPAGAEGAEGAEGHEGQTMGEHGHDHATMPYGMKDFHEVLSPKWHLEPGQGRKDDTCAALQAFVTAFVRLEAHPLPPGVHEAEWTYPLYDLRSAVDGLEGGCASDLPAFDAAFGKVHDAFHALMQLLPANEG